MANRPRQEGMVVSFFTPGWIIKIVDHCASSVQASPYLSLWISCGIPHACLLITVHSSSCYTCLAGNNKDQRSQLVQLAMGKQRSLPQWPSGEREAAACPQCKQPRVHMQPCSRSFWLLWPIHPWRLVMIQGRRLVGVAGWKLRGRHTCWVRWLFPSRPPLFILSLWKFLALITVTLSFIFDNYYSIMDYLDSKYSSCKLKIGCVINYFLFIFNALCNACVRRFDVTENFEIFLGFRWN